MKQKVPVPIIIVVIIIVLGGIGFFAWRQVGPVTSNEKPFSPTMEKPVNMPTTREEGMKMRRGGH